MFDQVLIAYDRSEEADRARGGPGQAPRPRRWLEGDDIPRSTIGPDAPAHARAHPRTGTATKRSIESAGSTMRGLAAQRRARGDRVQAGAVGGMLGSYGISKRETPSGDGDASRRSESTLPATTRTPSWWAPEGIVGGPRSASAVFRTSWPAPSTGPCPRCAKHQRTGAASGRRCPHRRVLARTDAQAYWPLPSRRDQCAAMWRLTIFW